MRRNIRRGALSRHVMSNRDGLCDFADAAHAAQAAIQVQLNGGWRYKCWSTPCYGRQQCLSRLVIATALEARQARRTLRPRTFLRFGQRLLKQISRILPRPHRQVAALFTELASGESCFTVQPIRQQSFPSEPSSNIAIYRSRTLPRFFQREKPALICPPAVSPSSALGGRCA